MLRGPVWHYVESSSGDGQRQIYQLLQLNKGIQLPRTPRPYGYVYNEEDLTTAKARNGCVVGPIQESIPSPAGWSVAFKRSDDAAFQFVSAYGITAHAELNRLLNTLDLAGGERGLYFLPGVYTVATTEKQNSPACLRTARELALATNGMLISRGSAEHCGVSVHLSTFCCLHNS
jgi:hypothetical protein